jgi:sterol desaturase/sphingolipid hydroxylase (fatty acid hydroxylase superfamily)
VFDLLDYIYHRAMHQIPGLWRFHLVHHTDTVMDVSTTLREHPGETVLRNGFLLIGVLVCGASFESLILRQTIQTFSNILSHTALRLPSAGAHVLGWVFITPNLHHVHHHFRLPFTNTNYGDTLSIWDRLFGTFAAPTASNSTAGLDTHPCRDMGGPARVMLYYLEQPPIEAEIAPSLGA